jgi:uncharacterized protein (TIGR03437 family)
MKSVFLFVVAAAMPALSNGQIWDSSGNGQLNGAYNFRQVQYTSDGAGNITGEIAYFGTISFSGTGTYTLSGSNTLVSSAGPLGIPSSGTYSVAGSGYGFLSDPLLIGASVYFLVSNHILIGSSTEIGGSNGSFVNDLFVAAPATPAFTGASFTGAYSIAGFLPGRGTVGTAADASYQLNPNGAGSLGNVSITGYGGASGGSLTQSSVSVPYSFSGGVGTIGFPPLITAPLYEGPETLYLSPDTNFVFGGSTSGFDFFVGVRNVASGTPALTPGLYYETGIDDDESQLVSDGTANIDTYYGVFNAFVGENPLTGAQLAGMIGHERLLYAGSSAESVTYTTTYPAGSYTGSANVGQLDPSATVRYTLGAGGIRIGFGVGPWLGIEVALPTPPPTPSGGAFLDPTGVVDTASSAPFTSGISPGEFVTLYNGVNLAGSSQCWTAGPPFPVTLGGVQVLVDGSPAPIYCVGPTITFIVPFEVSASPIASIQVVNSNASSNTVTAFVYKTTPGVFTIPSGGLGLAAAEHGDYSLVTTAHPALPGETVAVYLSGLGTVFPVNGVAPVDGGPAGPKGDNVVSNIEVDVAGFGSTSVSYAGLTPGEAGLYQINFQVPLTAPAGSDALAIVGPGSYSSQALLPVGTGSGSARPTGANYHVRLPRLNPSGKPSSGDIGGTIQP